MTLVEITKDYSTTLNDVKYDFKVGEIYEVSVPMGGNYVYAYRLAPNKTGLDSGARVLVSLPLGNFAYTTSGVKITPSEDKKEVAPTQNAINTKNNTNTKYIVLGIVAIGLLSMALIKK